ncbi:hypothetical protein HDV00_006357 [Rhizophlyctis rosea]|nr:hypothetical protein HDV00_006357 [Rhizophlyctis rosea]
MFVSRIASALAFAGFASAGLLYGGVNEASLEFGLGTDGPPATGYPGVYDKQYTAPDHSTIPYWSAQGLNAFRTCFAWERAQATAGGPLNETYVGYLDSWINDSTSEENGAINVILDVHNYARFWGKRIGVEESIGTLVDFWVKMGLRYKDNEHVIFDIMNEPHDMPIDAWWTAAQATVDAIRSTGFNNLILVPGIAWTGMWSWISSGNAEWAKDFRDDGNNFAFDMHQYFDSDYSGTSEICTHGVEVFYNTTAWLREHGFRGFLGEFAASTDASCAGTIETVLRYLDANSDVWIGYTWWAAGPWWGSYMYSVEPVKGAHQPQTYILNKFFPGNDAHNGEGIPSGSITIPAASPTPTRPVPTVTPTADIPIFVGGSGISSGWENWSWETNFTYAATTPAPIVGTNNLMAVTGTYAGISFKGPDFTYYNSIVFYVSGSNLNFAFRLDSVSETYSSPDVALSKICSGTITATTFTRCEVAIEPLGFHAWDRITISSKSDKAQTITFSNIYVSAAAGTQPTGTATITATTTTTSVPLPTWTTDATIYAGSLASGWQDWSWNTVNDFANTEYPAVAGSAILKSNATQYGGVSLKSPTAFGGYNSVIFYVRAASPNWTFRFDDTPNAIEGEELDLSVICSGTITLTAWTQCKVPLGSVNNWDRISLLSHTISEQDLYISNIYLSASGTVQPTSAITTTTTTKSTTTTSSTTATTTTTTTTTTTRSTTTTIPCTFTFSTQPPAVTFWVTPTVTVTAQLPTTTSRTTTTASSGTCTNAKYAQAQNDYYSQCV